MQNIRDYIVVFFLMCAESFAWAGKVPGAVPIVPEIRILSETQPAGGTVQIKFALTEPTPISTGTTSTGFDSSTFDSLTGIQLFSGTGDVFGVAVLQGSSLQVRYVSPGGTFGLSVDYPILTVAAHIRDTAPRGHLVALCTDATLSGYSGGQNISFLVKPGTLAIGGSVSIQNVVPGGGIWPAGTVIRVLGSGFQKGTSIRATNRIASSTIVSSNQIDMVLAEPATMDGARIDVKNPDGSADSYFSYLRGISLGESTETVLNATVPIFSSITYSNALLKQAPRGLTGAIVTGLAMQNSGAQPATVQLEAFSPFGDSLGKVRIVLPYRGKILRELGEYFATTLPDYSSVRATVDSPVQFLGIVADKSTGSATAFAIGR